MPQANPGQSMPAVAKGGAATSPSLRKRPVPVTRPSPVPAPAPPPVKALRLQAPTRDQKITKEKLRKGLSSVPTKQQPKPQFSSRAISEKPGDAEAAAAAAKEAKAREVPDSPFQVWLKAGNGARPDTQTARNYLLLGAPYLGTHDYERKDAVKDAGAVWHKNPDKKEGCTHRTVRFGWYAAPNERILEALLEIEPREEPWRLYDKGMKTVYCWSPRDCPAPQTGEKVLALLVEFKVDSDARDKREREEAKARQEERERLLRERDQQAGRGGDDAAEIARLKEQYGVEWTPELGRASRSAPLLGPTAGISDATRVLRGLDLGVVEAEHVRAGRFIDAARISDVQPATRGTPNPKQAVVNDEEEGPTRDYNKEPATAPVLLFGKSHPWMIRPMTASEWESARVAHFEHDIPQPQRRHRDTRCLECKHVIMQQFGCCACAEGDREWVECAKCGTFKCNGHQWCACKFGDEAWTTHQEQGEREHQAWLDDQHELFEGSGGLDQGAPSGVGGTDDSEGLDDYNDAPGGMMGAWIGAGNGSDSD